PQVPHVGEIKVREDHINLTPGQAKKLNVMTVQEEGFKGDIVIYVEGLPPGVTSLPGTEVKPDKGTPLDEGYKERFAPKAEAVSILLVADEAAATPSPQVIRVLGRPIINGVLGPPLSAKEIPLMIRSNNVETGAVAPVPAAVK